VAERIEDFDRLLEGVQRAAHAERVRRVAIRCQTAYAEAYARLIDLGFRVHWTDLRMVLRGSPQRAPRSGVVMSNWEI